MKSFISNGFMHGAFTVLALLSQLCIYAEPMDTLWELSELPLSELKKPENVEKLRVAYKQTLNAFSDTPGEAEGSDEGGADGAELKEVGQKFRNKIV